VDAAYQARYLGVAQTLLQATGGRPSDIPQHYAAHLDFTYSDGDISMVSLLPKITNISELEDYEIDEVLGLLSKVHPNDWPYDHDVESVDVEALLRVYDEDACSQNFAETPGTTSERAELVLRHAIESVFGDLVEKVRSTSGQFPDEGNQYLQQPDGSYKGSFEYQGNKFEFTIEPDEMGWTVQYRMTAKSLDSLPPITEMEEQEEESTRNRGWR